MGSRLNISHWRIREGVSRLFLTVFDEISQIGEPPTFVRPLDPLLVGSLMPIHLLRRR
jgi:hypothetical protein